MAQELITNYKYREFVYKTSDGFYAVDYAGLKFNFREVPANPELVPK